MNAPLCPSCRERMSSVEAGLIGVWSCMYCDGVWLPAHKAATSVGAAPDDVSGTDRPLVENLCCPDCGSTRFGLNRNGSSNMYECQGCRLVYLPKETVHVLAERLGGGNWNLGETFFKHWSQDKVAQVDGIITVAASVLLLLS